MHAQTDKSAPAAKIEPFDVKKVYPFQIEERANGEWIPTKRFKTREAADAYCKSSAFPARVAT